MKVGHSDNSLPQFHWTSQAVWKTPSNSCRTSVVGPAKAVTSTTTTTTSATPAESPSSSSSSSLPCSRIQHASCLLGNHVYLFGGTDRYMPLKDLWRFDLEHGRWESIVFKDSKIPHLQGHTMVSYRSQIFIFGGSFGESPDDIPLWIYSPDLNHVRKYVCEPLHECPVGRREHTAVVYKNSMYICGGILSSSGSMDELWAFNLEEEEWSRLPSLKDGKRHGHVSVVHCHAMWVHGGVSRFDSLSDLWMYNFELLTWTKVKGIGKSPSLAHHTAHVINDSIVIVGGSRKSTPSSSIWLYGIDNNTWRQVEVNQCQLFSPVFFHTSVLIDPQSIPMNSRDKSSQSTPHLKSHDTETVTRSVRPWTSPSPKEDPSHPPPSSNTKHPAVNVLTVHSSDNSTPLTDKNNNSEENLFSCTESCFKSYYPDAMELTEFKLNFDQIVDGLCMSHDGFPVQSSHKEKPCIRPASLEHCHDDLPLLERFCSVGSDVDLGQNNVVVSTSDEDVNARSLSSYRGQTSFQFDNLAFLPVISDANSSNDVNFPPNHIHPNTFEGRMLPGKSLLSSAKDMEKPGNCLIELDSNELVNIQSLDDLILEDLESCDNENGVLTCFNLATPSTSCVKKSSSLKDISSYDPSIDDKNIFYTSHPFCVSSPRKTRSNSCSSLTILFNNCDSNSHSPSSAMENKLGKMSNSSTTTDKCGKYIKHQTNCSRRNGFWLDKHKPGSQSNLQKMISSKKSTSTQTSTSLSSLTSNDDKPAKTTQEEKGHGHFSEVDHSTLFASESINKPHVKSELSIFSDINHLLLVLGGQTEMPSFTKTPLSIWKCKIY